MSRFAFVCCLTLVLCITGTSQAQLQVGAAVVDVSPPQFPVLINGGMLTRSADSIKTPVHARALVLSDGGGQRVAIVVVDSCMMPRPLLDEAKQLAAQRTKIRPDRMLISATHTHSAPSCMGALGTDADPAYVSFLREKLAESIVAAEGNLQPAKVGWGVGNAADFTALRRWIRRPDRLAEDPFGNPSVRANMHAGRNWDDVTGESGPEDPDLAMIAFQSPEGRPLAVLANFSMHYFGDQSVSADYFGLFCEGLQQHLAEPAEGQPPFVALLSHGCSGDIWRRDYTIPEGEHPSPTITEYTEGLLKVALDTYRSIEYQEDADLAMAERRMTLNYRVPDKQRLEWAQRIVDQMGDRPPKDTTEVYAREQLILHEQQSTEIVVQALRIGSLGIATTPNETYALTGLKIKLQSPLEQTMVIELANGGDGYIPPPEQHHLGGYNTWAARSAGLEVQAEPKIAEAALQLLEEVAGRPRRKFDPGLGAAGDVLAASGPIAWWRLHEMAGPRAVDASGNHRDGIYETGVVYFLAGPEGFSREGEINRAAHFAGGRVAARLEGLEDEYSVSLWFWNGLPLDARPVAGWIVSRGPNQGSGPYSEHVGLSGAGESPGRLLLLPAGGQSEPLAGRTAVPRWTWNHMAFTRHQGELRVYLNGQLEIEAESDAAIPGVFNEWFFGGRSDNQDNWEGRLDEIAVYSRALTPEEVRQLAAPATRNDEAP